MGGFKLMSDNCAAISADPEAPGSKPLPRPMPWPLPVKQQYAFSARHTTIKLYNTAVHQLTGNCKCIANASRKL